MKNEIWVAGYPSLYGGADQELDHNIDLWRSNGLNVNLVPMFGKEVQMEQKCNERGCITHQYHPKIFNNKTVVSFCNGNFLAEWPIIQSEGPPLKVIWFNCMTWTFDKELLAQKFGWIDLHGFVSSYQRNLLLPELKKCGNPVQEFKGYKPYFNPDNISQNIKFNYNPPDKWFAMGRISRDDANKFAPDTWNIFAQVQSPLPTKTFILGYGFNAHSRCGSAPDGLDWQIWEPNAIPVNYFYDLLHCLIHKTGGSRESYCRVVPECYSRGVPVIVEDDYAFPELVIDGVTGFRCKSSQEMSERASELAHNETLRKKIIYNARDFLIEELANNNRCWVAWEHLLI